MRRPASSGRALRAHLPSAALRAPLLVAAAALVPLAASCLARPAPPERFYRLELAAPPRLPAPAFAGVLEVERLRADAMTRGTALAYREDASAREVRTRAYARWADSPTLLVQRQMATQLRAAGLAREVVTPELGVEPDHRLGGHLLRFEEVHGPGAPRVVVEVEVVFSNPHGSGLALLGTYREEREIEGSEVEDVVRAYDAALSAILARLVGDAAAFARR